ncbi:acyltransferase [Brachybacterium sp. Z12]|uniref:acyltransferase family protein n=1 Tax=Brachybacterium sp. Z12 TaxID=2759167 RepID=UPI00223C43EF|nr:acyltransferase [Brachybacterium sp. Z12]
MTAVAESKSGPRAGRKASFRPDIQGLRAIAVLLVVLYHAGVGTLSGGFVGVDVFFVVSGFLITTHLLESLEAEGRISFGRFYAKRARRILPASLLVAALTAVAAWLWMPPLLMSEVVKGLSPPRSTFPMSCSRSTARTISPRPARRCSSTTGRSGSRSSSTCSGPRCSRSDSGCAAAASGACCG